MRGHQEEPKTYKAHYPEAHRRGHQRAKTGAQPQYVLREEHQQETTDSAREAARKSHNAYERPTQGKESYSVRYFIHHFPPYDT